MISTINGKTRYWNAGRCYCIRDVKRKLSTGMTNFNSGKIRRFIRDYDFSPSMRVSFYFLSLSLFLALCFHFWPELFEIVTLTHSKADLLIPF